MSWHDKNQTGDIIQRCTSDVDMIKNFIQYGIGYTDYLKSDFVNLTKEEKKTALKNTYGFAKRMAARQVCFKMCLLRKWKK